MKITTILISMLTVLIFNVNGQNTDVKELLDNQETRTEIFNAIAGDHELMMNFMKVARENGLGAMMMSNTENHEMGNMMTEHPEMMKMCMQKMKEKRHDTS